METTTETTADRTQDADGHGVRTDNTAGFYEDPVGEDGLYAGIPEADYHALERASQSVLGELLDKSPAHARAKMEEGFDPTPAQQLGTAIHTALLEPSLFKSEYDTQGQCEAETGSGDRCSYNGKHPVLNEETGEIRWFCGTHVPDEAEEAEIQTLSEGKMDTVESIQARAEEHPAASALLYEHPGLSELTVLWTHPGTGVRCKSRIDHLIRHPRMGYVAVDLKTARDASPSERGFPRSAAKWGYHRQAAFYRAALQEAGVPVDEYMILAVEKEPPYAVVPYIVYDDEAAQEALQKPIAQGTSDMEEALRQWKQCKQDGRWPTYTQAVERLTLPQWAFE